MNKKEYLNELRIGLDGLADSEIEERIDFYSDMIDDRVEEGMSEEEAINDIGSPMTVISQIMEDASLIKIVKKKITPKRRLRGWEIALIIIGFPLWFPLLIAFFAVLLVIYLSLWVVVLSFFAADLGLVGGGIYGFVQSILTFNEGGAGTSLTYIGLGVACIGLSLFMALLCVLLTKGLVRFIKKSKTKTKVKISRKKEN